MNTIKDLFNLRTRSGDVGVEIELEGCLEPFESNYWHTDEDGSLRHGLEYVMTKPVKMDILREVLDELGEHVDENCSVHFSNRAGTHVHVNVQHMSIKQLITFICAFICLEDILTSWCHPSRSGNHFCLKASDAEFLIDYISQICERSSLDMIRDDGENNRVRYSGVNILSVAKYGSLEFRSLESTVDMEKVYKWADVLVHIRDVSMLYPDPQKLIESSSIDGANAFVNKFLGPYAAEFKVGDWDRKFIKCMRLAQNIAYSRKNWGASLNIFDGKNIFA